jgi:AcrR family transcriptional regulator
MAASPALRLGGHDLAETRHVCGLFDGPDETADVLTPFIREGLEQGDRVIHIVQRTEPYQGRYPGADFSAALESGQLQVRTWDETYLSEGGFVASRMLGSVGRFLREGRRAGYPATRLIGEMEWALEDVAGADHLVGYERQVDSLLGRARDAMVCAYDVRRHSAGRIAAIVGAHQAVFVAGRLQRTSDSARAPARDRIIAAAGRLFAEDGVRSTGVDALIDAADVAKATFYRHFPSKDDLIVSWLKDPRTGWFERVRAQAEAAAASPREVLPRFFEGVAEWLEADGYRGCPYLTSSMELPDPAHPAGPVIRAYLDGVGRYLQERVAAAGYDDAERLGTELHALLAGSISLGVAGRTNRYALAARDAAGRLLEASERPEP